MMDLLVMSVFGLLLVVVIACFMFLRNYMKFPWWVTIPFVCCCCLCGCTLARIVSEKAQESSEANLANQSITRVPVEREPAPLPELPEKGDYAQDNAETLKTKIENEKLIAEIEKIKAEGQAKLYEIQRQAKQKIEEVQKQKDIELAALEQKGKIENEQIKATTYETGKWLWAIIAAAIACVVYCYRKVNASAALLGLVGFAGLFALVLAGQHYPKLVALSPIPFIILVAYIAYREGLISQALKACVRGIELADNDHVKREVSKQDKGGAVEKTSRKDIDQATVELAMKEREERKTREKADESDSSRFEVIKGD